MSYEAARKSIQGFFTTYFTKVEAQYIAWDNVKFEIPEVPWVRFSVQNNLSNYVSFGPNRLTRRQGIIFIQIFVPEDTETLVADQIVGDAVQVFESYLLSGVTFRSPNVREVGISNGWFQINISVDYHFDDVTTIVS